MHNILSRPRGLSRRRLLTQALLATCGLGIAGPALSNAAAAGPKKEISMHFDDLIHALRSIGTPVCQNAADRLAASTAPERGFNLHLRSAGMNEADAQVLADGIQTSNADNTLMLKSFSASFNPDLKDAGATALAQVFPNTMTELGLVGCAIGDAGGRAILDWAQSASNLGMICVEQNNFSPALRSRFKEFAASNRHILVVV